MKKTSFILLSLSSLVLAALEPKPIPRVSVKQFQSEGVFEGGSSQPANLEAVRFSAHKREGYERWVIDFSEELSRSVGKVAPHFQVRYQKAAEVEVPGGSNLSLSPPKFIFTFQSIKRNFLKKEVLHKIVAKSRYVKDIVLYPSIENGDTALEFILKDNVLFEPHQPKEKEGRLVLDLKNAPL